ncbi:hypothetical protein [Alkalimarinus alittae]|uniref:5'-nucleotidase n=1 Tax=Alkalimarinus alittae TaxID=2961619 RepID=A0ABY6N5L0_9ALTE|nr:hypothetical protein [Alkalimarinus alittae]UZE97364.1 hypothetical protein NKI27_06335 [Alkalimarinus alittae]
MNLLISNGDGVSNPLTLNRSQCAAFLEHGFVLITPIHIDMTGYDAISDVNHWIEGIK